MKIQRGFTRRGFIKGLGIAAGAAAGARIAGGRDGWIGTARAAEAPAILVIHLVGGFNACFNSADSLNGKFGINNDFVTLGNGLAVDKTFGSGAQKLSAFSLAHMATIGVRHGISSHDAARQADFTDGKVNRGVTLAAAMGGNASIKAAVVGTRMPDGPGGTVNGVSLQRITDMGSTIQAIGGGAVDPKVPERDAAIIGMTASQTMSQARVAANPTSLVTADQAYQPAIDTLKKPVMPFSYANLAAAYGKNAGSTTVNDFTTQIMAAELMITAGANLVFALDGGWDTHGDSSGTTVRNMMSSRILPPLNVFLNRMLADPSRNVTVVIQGDFARSLPGSDHQPNLSVTVLGKYVKQGTTGKTDANVGLSAATPSVPGLWAYLAALTKTGAAPFGANPHNLVL